MKPYKKLQIMKHALAYYVTRPNANEKDIETEKRLLADISEEVEGLKEKYGIKE